MIALASSVALASGVLSGPAGYTPLSALEVAVDVDSRIATAAATHHFEGASGALTFAAVIPDDSAVTGVRYRLDQGEWTAATAGTGSPSLASIPLPGRVFSVGIPDPAYQPIDIELTWQRVLSASQGELVVVVPLDDGGLNDPGTAVTATFDVLGEDDLDAGSLSPPGSVLVDGAAITASWTGGLGTDLALTWSEKPPPFGIGLWTYRPPEGPGFALVAIRPGAVTDDARVEQLFSFVLDTSSSMAGSPLEAGVATGGRWLRSLAPHDQFVVVAYDSQARLFRARARDATPEQTGKAIAFLGRQQARGLSDPGEALTGALRAMDDTIQGRGFFGCAGTIAPDEGPPIPGAPVETRRGRQVKIAPYLVWITDGGATTGLTDPTDLSEAVAAANPFGASLFAIGVGPEADTALLERLAGEHRGVARFAEDPAEVDSVVDELIAQIADPVLVRPWLDLQAAQNTAPAVLPDVAGGNEVLLAFQYEAPGIYELRLTGIRGAEDFDGTWAIDLPEADVRLPAVANAWAQLRARDLEVRARAGDDNALVELRELVETYGISSDLVPLGFEGYADAAALRGGGVPQRGAGCRTAAGSAGGWPMLTALSIALGRRRASTRRSAPG